jgi:hypothetical protein
MVRQSKAVLLFLGRIEIVDMAREGNDAYESILTDVRYAPNFFLHIYPEF